MMYPWGIFDVDDERYTPNSRASYPLRFLSNIKTPPAGGHPKTILFLAADANGVLPPVARLTPIKTPPAGGHPKTILFLAADANGVLPPVARLTPEQAMLWFLMGYTSKLAGTETGIVDPVSTFSRFFGEPFMPRNPDVYATMLGQRMKRYGSQVYLVNTGWSGGPYGVGQRMDIDITRAIVHATLAPTLIKPMATRALTRTSCASAQGNRASTLAR